MPKKLNFFKLLTLCSIFLFFNCQQDDFIEEETVLENAMVIKRINNAELKRKVPKVYNNIKALNEDGTSQLMQRNESEDNQYVINTDEIIEITQNGLQHYTFSISRTVPSDLVENLVLTTDAEGNFSGKIVRYALTEADKKAIELHTDVSLVDKITTSEVEDISSFASLLMRSDDCLTVIVTAPPCPSGTHSSSQIASGACSLISPANYNPVFVVQIIVDTDCLNGGDAGGGPSTPTNPDTPPINPSAGGGGGSPSPNPVVTTPLLEVRQNLIPCEQLKSFGDANKMNLKPSVDALKAIVNSPTNNIEYGVGVKKKFNLENETYSYEKTDVIEGDETSVTQNADLTSIGDLHTHPKKGHAMFSFEDVMLLIELYDNIEASRIPEIFMTLVCKDKAGNINVYTLKINDIAKLRAGVDAVLNHPKYAGKNYEDKINLISKEQAKKYDVSNGQLEKSFLQQFSTFGISLFKANDASITNWSQLELSTTVPLTVKSVPCY